MSDCNQTGCRNMRTAPAYRQNGASASCGCHTPETYGRSSMQKNPSCAGSRSFGQPSAYRNRAGMGRGSSDQYMYECEHNDALDGFALAMGYVPFQKWENIYEPDKALQRGTIFMDLDKPFLGCRGGKRS